MNNIELSDKATKLVQDNLYWGNNSADQLDLIWAELRAALPKPLKVGDLIQHSLLGSGVIEHIKGDWAWVHYQESYSGELHLLSELERV